MKSSKHGGENNRGISGRLYTSHQRFYHALSLGPRCYDDKERKWRWQFTDNEIQRHVVRSIAAFLDCISSETCSHPLVKDSVADMVGALVGILQYKNEAISIAANVAIKLIRTLPTLIQPCVLDLVHPLSSMLPSHQLQVSISCATALNLILSNLSKRMEKKVWEVLGKTESVAHIVRNIRDFSRDAKPIEYFKEMALLLSTILWRWPPSRYFVWSDAKFMRVLEDIHVEPDFAVKVTVLKLYSALALCGSGAKKLLENGEALLQMMVRCMERSNPLSVRIEGFRLAQCLAISEEGCLEIMSLCCEPFIKAIIAGMSGWSLHSGKVANDQISLLVEACHLAMITRWAGEHHIYFWKLGIGEILLDLLLDNFHKRQPSQHILSLEEKISIAQQGLSANFLLVLRPYIWDILGWLAIHCGEDFSPNVDGNELGIDILIICACLAFWDSIRKCRHICQHDVSNTLESESAPRAVLMLIYSPCTYISSKARFILSEIIKPNGKNHVKYLINTLNSTSSRKFFGTSDMLKSVITLTGLTCYSGLPQFRRCVIKNEGTKTLLNFITWCLSNHVRIERLSFAPHLHNTFHERTCCWNYTEDWEGRDILLLYSLWGLSELIKHPGSVKDISNVFAGQVHPTEAQLISTLREIWSDSCSPGPRWFAAYILSCFGLYGFQSRLAKRIGKALDDKEYADMQLILANGESLTSHCILLVVRCPALLPPEELPLNKNTSDDSSVRDYNKELLAKFHKEVHLSSRVDQQALVKLMEFVYLGYLEAGEELVKKLKHLAKCCNLQSLLQMLYRKIPKWGTAIPSYDLTLALGPSGNQFSDIILEAKATELLHWKCNFCSLPVPHMHVHKVILWSSCDYLRALFQSGMQESHSQIIKVPVCLEAMVKLVHWFYSDALPNPPSGCLWDNMNTDEKLSELTPYVELCWLAEFWFLEEVQEACSKVVVSCLDSTRHLSVKLIQTAANLSLWKLAEVAANYMAPLYRQLHESGELQELDEMLVDMVRAASVRLSQGGADYRS